MGFLRSTLALVATAAVSSFGAAALFRSKILCIAVSTVLAQLLFVVYSLIWLALSGHHAPDDVHAVARGLSITVVFGAPLFLSAATGFTFFARWIYGKDDRW